MAKPSKGTIVINKDVVMIVLLFMIPVAIAFDTRSITRTSPSATSRTLPFSLRNLVSLPASFKIPPITYSKRIRLWYRDCDMTDEHTTSHEAPQIRHRGRRLRMRPVTSTASKATSVQRKHTYNDSSFLERWASNNDWELPSFDSWIGDMKLKLSKVFRSSPPVGAWKALCIQPEQKTAPYEGMNLLEPLERLGANFELPSLETAFGELDLGLIRSTCRSQGTAFVSSLTVLLTALAFNTGSSVDLETVHWAWDDASVHSLLDWNVTPLRLFMGFLAAIPLIGAGAIVQNSDHQAAYYIHYSVTKTVNDLFGQRNASINATGRLPKFQGCTTAMPQVFFSGLGMAGIAAVSEELVFRGLLPVVLASYTHSVCFALLGQALLYGLGQMHPEASIEENTGFAMMQFMNGLWYGAVYLAAGGDIAPVVLAHIFYQCHVLCGTWKHINDQLDYTNMKTAASSSFVQKQSFIPSEDFNDSEWETLHQEAGGKVSREIYQSCRRFFFAFDLSKTGSLSLSDAKRAVAFAFRQETSMKSPPSNKKVEVLFQEVIRGRSLERKNQVMGTAIEDRMNLSEFLHLLFALQRASYVTLRAT